MRADIGSYSDAGCTQTAPSNPTLLGLARGTMSEETLTVLCYQFYERTLIDIEEKGA